MSRSRATTDNTEFVEALARGCDVIKAFSGAQSLTLSEVATRTNISRQTARRVLLTLEQLGYARRSGDGYSLTAQTLELGTECVSAQDRWDLAQAHLVQLVEVTHESSSIGTLDGNDVVYMARVAVPKVIALAVRIGTRLPAPVTSMGHVLLADLDADQLDRVLERPSASGVLARIMPTREQLERSLAATREQGWAIADQLLAVGVRSLAAPLHDASGRTVAALNVTVHASETSVETLVGNYLPRLLETASRITADWAHLALLPSTEISTV